MARQNRDRKAFHVLQGTFAPGTTPMFCLSYISQILLRFTRLSAAFVSPFFSELFFLPLFAEQAVTLYHVRAPLVVSAVQAAALLLASFAQRGHFVLEVRLLFISLFGGNHPT